MDGQNNGAVLVRGLVFLAWLASALFSGIWLFGFGTSILSVGSLTVPLVMPLLSAIAWTAGYRLRLKSPWIEMVAVTAPLTQLAFFLIFPVP